MLNSQLKILFLLQCRKQAVEVHEFVSFLNKEHSSDKFSQEEIDAGLEKMSSENQIMVADNMLFLI